MEISTQIKEIPNDTARPASYPRDRKRNFTPLCKQSLGQYVDDYKYTQFALSPLSPKAFPRHGSATWENIPTRAGDPVQDAHSPAPTKVFNPTISSLTLASSGLADALPTPGIPENLWAYLGETRGKKNKENTRAYSSTTVDDSTISPNNPNESAKSKQVNRQMFIQPPIVSTESTPTPPHHRYGQVFPRTTFSLDDSGLMTPPPAPFSQTFADKMSTIRIDIGTSPFDPPPAPQLDCFPVDLPASPRICGPSPIDTSLWALNKQDQSGAMDSPVLPEERAKAAIRSMDPPLAPTSANFSKDVMWGAKRAEPAPIDTARTSPTSTLSSVSTPPDLTPTGPARAPFNSDLPYRADPRYPRIMKNVRFADLKSPTASHLKSPTYYGHLRQSPSPPIFSPLTPVAMSFAFPAVTTASPPLLDIEKDQSNYEDEKLTNIDRGRSSSRRDSVQWKSRARSLSPPRSARFRPYDDTQIALLPTTVYNPGLVHSPQTNPSSRAQPVASAPKTKPYTLSAVKHSDKAMILQSYFQHARSPA